MLERTGAYPSPGSQEDPVRGESSSMSDGTKICRVRQQVERFIDADLLLPEDGQRLLEALDDALAEGSGARAAARAATAAFVDRVQALIAAGVLSAGQGQPSIEVAMTLVAGLARAGSTDG
jgi:hypothetical protein